MKQYTVLLGGYGSGKTELALNLAVQAAKAGKRVALVDLDIVNPFFKSGFHQALLREAGVRLIVSEFTLTGSDLPVVTPEVSVVFDTAFDAVFFDAGGDPVGATALGRYYSQFARLDPASLEVLLVVNVCRPFTSDTAGVLEMKGKLEHTSRLQATGILNNANLMDETHAEHLLLGDEILRQVSRSSGLPVLYWAATERVVRELGAAELVGTPILVERRTRLEYLDFEPPV